MKKKLGASYSQIEGLVKRYAEEKPTKQKLNKKLRLNSEKDHDYEYIKNRVHRVCLA